MILRNFETCVTLNSDLNVGINFQCPECRTFKWRPLISIDRKFCIDRGIFYAILVLFAICNLTYKLRASLRGRVAPNRGRVAP